jgi:hypothetical protein
MVSIVGGHHSTVSRDAFLILALHLVKLHDYCLDLEKRAELQQPAVNTA